MSKRLAVGNEIFNYPVTGSSNYGEDATAWAEAVTEVLETVIGPGDILTQQVQLVGASGNITGLAFDTTFVQRVSVEGLLTKESILPISDPSYFKLTESFNIEGVFDGTNFKFSVESTGDDTQVVIDVAPSSGQFTFTQVVTPNSETTIKFKAKAIIDEEVLGL